MHRIPRRYHSRGRETPHLDWAHDGYEAKPLEEVGRASGGIHASIPNPLKRFWVFGRTVARPRNAGFDQRPGHCGGVRHLHATGGEARRSRHVRRRSRGRPAKRAAFGLCALHQPHLLPERIGAAWGSRRIRSGCARSRPRPGDMAQPFLRRRLFSPQSRPPLPPVLLIVLPDQQPRPTYDRPDCRSLIMRACIGGVA